ncbi:hypothetical protein [Caldibacillus thermoamylovorans]
MLKPNNKQKTKLFRFLAI